MNDWKDQLEGMRLGTGDIARVGYERWTIARRPLARIIRAIIVRLEKVNDKLGLAGRIGHERAEAQRAQGIKAESLPAFDTTYYGQKIWNDYPEEAAHTIDAVGLQEMPEDFVAVARFSQFVQENTPQELSIEFSLTEPSFHRVQHILVRNVISNLCHGSVTLEYYRHKDYKSKGCRPAAAIPIGASAEVINSTVVRLREKAVEWLREFESSMQMPDADRLVDGPRA